MVRKLNITAREVLRLKMKRIMDGHEENFTYSERRLWYAYKHLSGINREDFETFIREEEEKENRSRREKENRCRNRRQNRSPSPIHSEYVQNRSPPPIRSEYSRSRSRSPLNCNFGEPLIYRTSPMNVVDSGALPTPTTVNSNNNAVNSFQSAYSPQSTLHVEERSHPFIMGRLKNIGNTCYMNAVLYTLRFTPTLLHEFHHLYVNMLNLCTDMIELSNNLTENACHKDKSNLQLHEDRVEGVELEENIQNVIIEWHGIFAELNTTQDPVKTDGIQKAIVAKHPAFKPFEQQDSHEFLMCLLNCLRDCSDEFLKSIDTYPQMFQRIQNPKTNLSFDFFNKNFIGRRLSRTRCNSCENSNERPEKIIDLFVPLNAGSNIKEDFIQTSCLTHQSIPDKVACGDCLRNTERDEFITFPQLPRILIIQLGRFDNNLNKITTASPTPLSLDCFCVECTEDDGNSERRNGHQYQLFGIIVHLGDTLRSGHYMTYVKALTGGYNQQRPCSFTECCNLSLKKTDQAFNDEWYICDDDKITVVPELQFLSMVRDESSRKTPYILFYARNDLIAEE